MKKMTAYITYMEVSFNSEGVTPGDLTENLRRIGWKPIYGRYDFAYEWGTNWGNKDRNIQEFLNHLNNYLFSKCKAPLGQCTTQTPHP